MSNLPLFKDWDVERRDARHAEREALRERQRVALLRPEARAEYDRAMREPETVHEDETLLEALARRLRRRGFDDAA